ncbi:lipid II:glycine glycyltransferase FemX [Haloarcula nitratireducens]|uniref:GNAT family N-acetyltransferase n=1 Tax=Haloarcula nitratireducens TaxID=2487749 RepID=A0AAW4P8Z1_9EURY|nr:GNAT family N-acetyltransferase [Halomicroarcula nitratireducens]MBX0294058.1 GNAT family N-acetyltransferase [Halomicroarcula nitratireducens]
MRVERLTLSEWGDALPNTGYEVFHRPAALSVVERYADGELVLFGGFKGDQPVGLLPVVETTRTVGRTLMSPPPGMNIPRLGPIVMPTSPKQRKRERVNKKFVESVLEEIDAMGPLSLVRLLTPRQYGDPRPFQWADFDLTTQFTYVVDLAETDAETVLESFSKSLRRDIRRGRESDVTVSVEGLDAAEDIYRTTRDRYADQNRGFSLSWPYVRDLVTELGDDARTYVARSADGEFLSGVTVLYGPDTAYFWQGGAKTDHDGIVVNSLIHWRVIEDILADPTFEGVTEYDLMGANTRRLCDYKGKFAGELVPYYTIETDSAAMNIAKSAFMAVTR